MNRRDFIKIFNCGLHTLLFVGFALEVSAAPRVDKVEPPNWWSNHTFNPVRLLVRGNDLHGARVTATTPGITPGAVVANPSGNYVFVNVAIAPQAVVGEHPLTLETATGKVAIPFRLEAPLDPATHFQGITSDDVIYLIMPDRFANGDPSNDMPPGAPPAATDRANPRAYHGGDFRGIIERLSYIKDLGATALWLNPWCDNWNGIEGEGDRQTTFYHGYHVIDYYAVEDRFGDMATLCELVQKAHALGLKVIQDQVANHVGIQHPWVEDPPLDNWFHPKRLDRQVKPDVLLSPHSSPAARQLVLDRWFTERLPDLNQEEPEVARYEIQNALWWVGMTGIDGIRQDTVQFLPRFFIRDLNRALDRQYPRMWMVGEAWQPDPAHVAFFMGGRAGWDGIDTAMDAAIDFPLWLTSREVFTGAKPVSALREVMRHDALYPDASQLMTMVGNHDAPRFQSLERGTLADAKLHTAFTLAVRGTPQIYYGDEIGLSGGGDHASNRADFPGGFPGDRQNAFEPSGRDPEQQAIYRWTRDWLRLRRDHPALRRGRQIDLAWDDETYLFARQHEDDLVVIAINRSSSPREIGAPVEWLGLSAATVHPLFGPADGQGELTSEKITFRLPPRTIAPFAVKRKR